jgi:hypothetical protein
MRQGGPSLRDHKNRGGHAKENVRDFGVVGSLWIRLLAFPNGENYATRRHKVWKWSVCLVALDSGDGSGFLASLSA